MVKFEGKYELEKSENFGEYLKTQGMSDEALKGIDVAKATVNVEVQGDQYKLTTKLGDYNHELSFSIGKPFKEKLRDQEIDNIATLDGNKIIIKSKSGDRSTDRTYEFSDSGFVTIYQTAGVSVVGKRYFKRV